MRDRVILKLYETSAPREVVGFLERVAVASPFVPVEHESNIMGAPESETRKVIFNEEHQEEISSTF